MPQKDGTPSAQPFAAQPTPASAAPAGTASPTAGAAASVPGSNASWIKSHQIEGDGLISLLYHHLWKKNKNFQSCPLARCPDTVTFEHNFPRGWYAYDAKNKEIVKRAGKYLDSVHIYNAFSKSQEGIDIVAQYCHTSEDEHTGEMVTSVEFFTKDDLFHFLNIRKDRPDGILQKFLPPKTKQNHQIQAVWSPRVTLVQRRMNKHALTDRFFPPYERCVTFDGPSHYSEDGHCAHKTKEFIKKICASVVDHFHNTDHKTISRMVLYFKVDKNDNIWLLWANSLRIGPVKFHPGHHRIPLNLSPLFVGPRGKDGIAADDEDELRHKLEETDEHQIGLSNDQVFARTICGDVPYAFPRIGSPSRSRDKSHHSRPKSSASPALPLVSPTPTPDLLIRLDDTDDGAEDDATDTEGDLPQTASGLLSRVDGGIRDQAERILRQRSGVAAVMDDIVYDLYSHSLRKTSSDYFVLAPTDLGAWLSREEIDAVMAAICLAPAPEAEVGMYTCEKLNKPMGQLNESLNAALDQIFEGRLMVLQESHRATQLPSAPSVLAAPSFAERTPTRNSPFASRLKPTNLSSSLGSPEKQ